MIRGTVFKILKSKPVYTVLYKISFVTVLLGMMYIYILPGDGQKNEIEENAVHPVILHDTKVDFILTETKRIQEELQKVIKQNDYSIFQEQNQEVYQQYQNLDTLYRNKSTSSNQFISKKQQQAVLYIKQHYEKYQMSIQEQQFQVPKSNGKIENGVNIVGLYKVPRSPDFECNLITFEYSSDEKSFENMAFVMSLITMLTEQNTKYLSRNILFVAYDGKHRKQAASSQEFLKAYFSENTSFLRAGIIRQAVNFDLKSNFNTIIYKIFGKNGRVTERDYFLNFNKVMRDTEISFRYTESRSPTEKKFDEYFIKPFEKLLVKVNFKDILKTLGFKKNYISFTQFINTLIYTIYGYPDDPHSYQFEHGIMAITISGAHQTASNQKHDKVLKSVALIIEATNHVCMSLDEQLHAGSTLYFPLDKGNCLTVAKYVFPVIIVCASLAIQQLYNFFQIRQYSKGLRVWLNCPLYIINLFALLKLPETLEFLFQKFGNPDFSLSVIWENYNDPVLDQFVYALFIGVIVIYLILNTIFVQIMKQFSDYDLPYTREDRIIFRLIAVIYTMLCSVFWLFYTVSFAFFIVIFYPLPSVLMRRFIPANKQKLNILLTLGNYLMLGGYGYALWFLFQDHNIMFTLKDMLVQYMQGGFQGYLFFASTLVNTTIMYFRYYLM